MGRSKTVAWPMLLCLLLVAWPLASTGWAQVSFPSRPPSGGVISDEIGLITVEHRQEIDRLGAALLKDTGYPVTVATIRSLAAQKAAGYTIERYASELLKVWNLALLIVAFLLLTAYNAIVDLRLRIVVQVNVEINAVALNRFVS